MDYESTLKFFWELAKNNGLISEPSQRIVAALDVGYNVQFNPEERLFKQRMLYIITKGIGCAFYDDAEIGSPSLLVGLEESLWQAQAPQVQIAILDSLFTDFKWTVNSEVEKFIFDDHPKHKGVNRTYLICNEVEKLLISATTEKMSGDINVGLIGVSRLQAKILSARGYQIQAWDLNPRYIGKEILPNIKVKHSLNIAEQIAQSDVILISGMAMANQTLKPILSECIRQRKKSVLWAVTGANLAPSYLNDGLNTAICEKYPQHFLPGKTELNVYRRKI